MITLCKIGFGTPLEETVLLYWERTGHFEDGTLYYDEDGELRHYLFDGESLNEEPSHYALIPKEYLK